MQTATLILANIPVWVWAIFAFIIVMGLRLSREQRMSRGRLMIVPAIWLAYGAWGVQQAFGLHAAPLLAWASGLVASVALVRWSGWPGQARTEGAAHVVPGSWVPMGLMLAIFIGKFAQGMALGMNPALAQQVGVAAAFSGMFGALSGAFLGRSLNLLGAANRQPSPTYA